MLSSLKSRLALALSALGIVAVFAAPGAQARHHHHHRHHGRSMMTIPQRNGGDRDGDNNGARSDGDGNV